MKKKLTAIISVLAMAVSILVFPAYADDSTTDYRIPDMAYQQVVEKLSIEFGLELKYDPSKALASYTDLTLEEFECTLRKDILEGQAKTAAAKALAAKAVEYIPDFSFGRAVYPIVTVVGDCYFDGGYLHCSGGKWNPQGYWQFHNLASVVPYTRANASGGYFVVDGISHRIVDSGRTYSFTCTGIGYNFYGVAVEPNGVRYTEWTA